MNRRTLKKKCQRAMQALIERHHYPVKSFVMADGEEAIDAPPNMERRFVRHGFMNPGVLKGTPLLFERASHEYDEWDYALPSRRLDEIELWENMSEAERQRLVELSEQA